jgi:hypothetical protein
MPMLEDVGSVLYKPCGNYHCWAVAGLRNARYQTNSIGRGEMNWAMFPCRVFVRDLPCSNRKGSY